MLCPVSSYPYDNVLNHQHKLDILRLLEEGFFEFVEADAVEGEVFRALAEAGDASFVMWHILGGKFREGVLFAVTFNLVVFCYYEFCACWGVDDFITNGYAVFEDVEVCEFGVDEFICVEEGFFSHWLYH